MRSTYQHSLDFSTELDRTCEAVRYAITNDAEAEAKDIADGVFTARVPMSTSSWGERLTVTVSPLDRGTRVTARSTCSFPLQIIDWGKNRRNVTRILARVESQLRAGSGELHS